MAAFNYPKLHTAMPETNAYQALEQLGRQWENPQSAAHWVKQTNRKLGQTLLDWTQENFQRQGGLLQSGGWPPRASNSSRTRNTRPLLVNTGRLQRSFQLLPSATHVQVRNTAPYAARHHLGKGVPKRPLLPDLPQAQQLLQHTLNRLLPLLPFLPQKKNP